MSVTKNDLNDLDKAVREVVNSSSINKDSDLVAIFENYEVSIDYVACTCLNEEGISEILEAVEDFLNDGYGGYTHSMKRDVIKLTNQFIKTINELKVLDKKLPLIGKDDYCKGDEC